MPTYEYNCPNCNHSFEEIQSIKDEPLKICPNCGKESLKKLVSGGAGLIFKGSGFYLTDYKNKPESETKSTKKETKKETTTAENKDSTTNPKPSNPTTTSTPTTTKEN